MRILVVDDSAVMRKTVIRMLNEGGFGGHEIREAVDGVDALARIGEATPDLILCDWNMPNLDGMGLLERLTTDRALERLAFGFVTSEGSAERRQQAADAGARFLVAKPFDARTLKDAIDGALAAPAKAPPSTPPPRPAEPEGAHSVHVLCAMSRVEAVLAQLTRTKLTVAPGEAMRIDTPKSIAVYRLAGSGATAFCMCELSLGASLGAAFGGLQPDRAARAIESGRLDRTLAENLKELFNVGSQFFEPIRGVHLKLDRVVTQEGQREFARQLMKLQDHMDLRVEVAGYGAGGLSLLLCGDVRSVEVRPHR